jgi:Phasin protein
MTAKPEDLVTRTWKQQIGTAVRLAGVISEESRKIREYQLAAALDAHSCAAAALEQLEKAPDANALWRIQGEWLSANLGKSLAYWRRLYEGSTQTQVGVLKCLCEPVDMAAPQASAGSNVALFGMMGDAYKRWLDTTTRFYAGPGAAAEARKAA